MLTLSGKWMVATFKTSRAQLIAASGLICVLL